MFNAFGTRQVASIYTAIADYYVILESQPEFQTDITALPRIYVKTASGISVPLEAVTRLRSVRRRRRQVERVSPLDRNSRNRAPR